MADHLRQIAPAGMLLALPLSNRLLLFLKYSFIVIIHKK